MQYAMLRNPLAWLNVISSKTVRLVAGGTGDATAVYTAEVDRRDTNMNHEGALVAVAAHAVLGGAPALSVPVVLQHTDDANFNTAENITSVTLGTLAIAATGDNRALYQVDLSAIKNRWRIKLTPDLAAANTDTAEVSAVVILTGSSKLPIDS